MAPVSSVTATGENSGRRHRCPTNGVAYPSVSEKTMLHHLKTPWNVNVRDQRYYYCDDPECSVVYFGEDNEVFSVEALRTPVGMKSRDINATICYCFGVSKREAATDPAVKAYVTEKTKTGQCACEVKNPYGRCCLRDFARR